MPSCSRARTRRTAEAIDYFVYRAVREIGSLTAALGGLDALVFTAGTGDHSAVIRQRICLGVRLAGRRGRSAANERGRRLHLAGGARRPCG